MSMPGYMGNLCSFVPLAYSLLPQAHADSILGFSRTSLIHFSLRDVLSSENETPEPFNSLRFSITANLSDLLRNLTIMLRGLAPRVFGPTRCATSISVSILRLLLILSLT